MSGLQGRAEIVKLPERAVILLHQFSSDESRSRFAVGDLSVELVDEMGQTCSKSAIRRAIANESGLAYETVRDSEFVARRVPPDVRANYQVLSFHQWKALAAAKTSDDLLHLAKWAVESADNFGGRPAPVSAIRFKMRNGPYSAPAWERWWDKVVELLDMLVIDDKTDPEVLKFCREALSIIKERDL